ncbi:MAG: hypothetical protein A3C90_02580 [Candidatus Magasanikbacteria bacterium RIFCSPHIGHO2_02_FULL_51_14]|uniref:Ribonuclease VapC n=1 Tax=Candidatus Magasanikbacteria bacterium RIFCSPHIGHO2_02_FULL_51_14 TaxID=1798683 RepID=A0A1F6MEF7_9BACT|nr:MAG: hypothetical protein A3C90_02580 [Candidatus Magasanikbacteria bacterium RIFCSPHIGHO2_02_FULL_51_14]
MGMIVLDTNAIIYYLQDDKKAVRVIEKLRRSENVIAISTITEMELLSFPGLTDAELLRISVWLNELFIVPVESSVAREAAKLKRENRIKTPDAIIAATAQHYSAKLVTRDKSFQKISRLGIVLC